MPEKRTIISVKNLVKDFRYHEKAEGLRGSLVALVKRKKKNKHAVRNISFKIRRGEFVGFIGPNGAGKTTTLKVLSGILTATSGDVRVLGFNPAKRENDFRRQISIVLGTKENLYPTLPPTESFELHRLIYGVSKDDYKRRLKRLAKLLNVEEYLHRQTRKLSLGQRMKCELIQSLLHDPKVLFLDEPTIGLDVLSQRRIRKFLTEYNQRKGTTIILTSHNMDDVEDLCARLIIINEGEIGYDGSLDKIIHDYSKVRYISARFGHAVLREKLETLGDVVEYSPLEVQLCVPTADIPKRINELTTRFDVKDIGLQDVHLEEIVSDIFVKAEHNE